MKYTGDFSLDSHRFVGADLMVSKITDLPPPYPEEGASAGLKHPPIFLVEVMSPYNLEPYGEQELSLKLRNSFAHKLRPCRVAWIIYHARVVPSANKHGVEVHNGKYEEKP